MRKNTLIVLASLALSMVGCGEIFPPVPGGYMKVTTLVLDEQNDPIANLRVIYGGVMTPEAAFVGVDTLYTNDKGVVEYGTICLTLDNYTTRVIFDDINGLYAKDSIDVTFLTTDFKPSKQYTLGAAEKETTARLTKMK